MEICRYCSKEIEKDQELVTFSYWQGVKFFCHKECKTNGEKQESFDCQNIDADCNDCKFFKRGELIKKWLSSIIDGKPGLIHFNTEVFNGHCLKFDKITIAQPKKCTMKECFEHRRN